MFVDAGVKIDIAYYRNVLLSQQLLSVIRQISDEFLIFFQQDSAPAHRAHNTIYMYFLERDTLAFISPDLVQTLILSTQGLERYAAQNLLASQCVGMSL